MTKVTHRDMDCKWQRHAALVKKKKKEHIKRKKLTNSELLTGKATIILSNETLIDEYQQKETQKIIRRNVQMYSFLYRENGNK